MSRALFRNALILLSTATSVAAVDFQREIRPILSDHCFQCHGPDSTTRMAGLRLDWKDAALATRKRGAAIVPKDVQASLLVKRITETDPARRMPPEYSHKSLNPQQIALLKKWIAEGAPWTEHWAFRAPRKQDPPTVRNAAWSRNPIDRFILAKLESQGLTPAPQADERTLIRRVALDLTGLPPKSAEIETFLKDKSPDAYERMVDRYSASPHYGEHRARYWLDAARYGDTHGIHIDNYREIWPYRDWVIQAYNRNERFDQFTIDQLAGDLLPNPTLDQQIATGFHRCGVTTNEAGIIEDEYAEIYAKDRTDTTSAVWLGMTVGCATCHDHKFDPILQKDFYALGAFFRNTTQAVMDGNISDTPPILTVPKTEDRDAWAATSKRLAALGTEMADSRKAANSAFQQWRKNRKPGPEQGPLEETAQIFQGVSNQADTKLSGAPKLDPEKPFSISLNFQVTKENGVLATHQNPSEKGRGWVIELSGGRPGCKLIGDGGKAIEVRAAPSEKIAANPHNVVVTYDGSRKASGLALFIDGHPAATQSLRDANPELRGDIATDRPVMLNSGDVRVFNRVVTESEAALLADWNGVESGDDEALLTYFLVRHYGPYQTLAVEQDKLNLETKRIASRGAITMVMHENPDSPPTAHVLYRGAYDAKRQLVEADTPSALPPMTPDLPRNRLGFAQWLFKPEHPLTARVTVNRMWQEIFGTGIVKTVDDFGSQGEAPSHPELLDWLAVDFRENGWDVKRFYKQVLMSATYRQAALATPAKIAKDPENRLLSRGARFRMDGEVVRDYALAASGLLSPEIGGPSVKPYQPEGVWESVAMDGSNTRFYKRDSGDALYRRSMYTFWKRSAPPASMEIFNAPTRESCTVRRERTDTPLQALVTMNDVQFMEAARILAERGMQSVAALDERLDYVASQLLARPLTTSEKAIARKTYRDFESYYDGHPADARKLLNTGERKADPALPAAEYAALTLLSNQLLNLDEVLTK